MTQYTHKVFAICQNQEVGDAVARKISNDPNSVNEFIFPLRPEGSGSPTPTAWACNALLKQAGLELVQEFDSEGPYHLLNEYGIPNEAILAAKAITVVQYGTRGSMEGMFEDFIQDQGYEVMDWSIGPNGLPQVK